MRQVQSIILAIGLVGFLGSAALAQTSVQQSSQDLAAATVVGTSATSASTITIPAVSGQYFYVTGIDITNCAGGTAVTAAAPTSITTTNLNGAAWTVGSGVTAGLCQPSPAVTPFSKPLKSAAAGVAVTVVLPTFATNQTIRVSVYGYYGS